jgi:hypothetical protein
VQPAVSPSEGVLTTLSFRPTLGYPHSPLARGPTHILSHFACMPSSLHPCRSTPLSQVNRLLTLQVRRPHHKSGPVRLGSTSLSTLALALYALSRISTRMFLFSCPFSQSLSVAFASRGNWGVDLQAGSDFGYKLLFIVLLAGVFAVILQVTFFVSIIGTLLGDSHPFVEGIIM